MRERHAFIPVKSELSGQCKHNVVELPDLHYPCALVVWFAALPQIFHRGLGRAASDRYGPPMKKSFFAMAIFLPVLSACGDEPRRPIGGTCGGDSECESGLCLVGACMDPVADDDGDGLVNGLEGSLGSNPLNRDSDYDGIADADELDSGNARDTDGDGTADILESQVDDGDGDCLPDEFDADDSSEATDLALAIAKACLRAGVCGESSSAIAARCVDRQLVCDYAAVPGYEAEEATCDGLDNDCDGRADEGHPDGDGDDIADCADSDLDGDGHDGATDNCQSIANPGQEDADGDGSGDACDAPTAPTLTSFRPNSPANVTTVEALGEAEAYAEVSVFRDARCDTELGRGTSSVDGTWTASISVEVGANTFWLRAVNRAGLSSPCVESDLLLEIDQTPPIPPVVHTFEAVDWDDDSAVFQIDGSIEVGASIDFYTDTSCTTPLGSEVTLAGPNFAASSEIPGTVEEVFARVTDIAGNLSPCVSVGRAFGDIEIEVSDIFGPRADVPVMFHYRNGLPASALLYTDLQGVARVRGFAGFGVTVVRSQFGENDFGWMSALGLRPGDVARFGLPINGDIQFDYRALSLNFPRPPEGTMWVKAIAPCGGFYIGSDPNVTSGSISIFSSCATRASFEVAVVAMDRNDEPLAYVMKKNVPMPTLEEEVTEVVFDGPWKTDLLENRMSISLSAASNLEFGSSLEVGGDQLESIDWTRRGALGLGGETTSIAVRVPPFEGATSRWQVTLTHPAQNGEGTLRKLGRSDSVPFSLEFDADTDFLPRIYSLEPIYEDLGQPMWDSVPVGLEWRADEGLGLTDVMTFDASVASEAGWISWRFVSRPRESGRGGYGRLALPKIPRVFPGGAILASAYSLYVDELSFFDAEEASSFGDILVKCVIGGNCLEDFTGFIDESRCCSARGGE